MRDKLEGMYYDLVGPWSEKGSGVCSTVSLSQ